eukprot:Em0056g16a
MASDKSDAVILRAGARLGYTAIRPNQHKAVKSFIEGSDVFISLPTGSGKSFCYSVLPFIYDDLYHRVGSIVIVVSPLIALMKDQVAALTGKGLKAAYLSSKMDDVLQKEQVVLGEVQVVFIGPELLMLNATWREMLRTRVYRKNLVAFIVDEAHCIIK